jgi:dTDP-4-amino-4,6-dideoxygalactose transaminase
MTSEPAIGGEMVLRGREFAATAGSAWPEFSGRNCVRCNSGRAAIKLAIDHWASTRRRPSAVWLPHYMCPSVADFVKLNGYTVRFYCDGPDASFPFEPPCPKDCDVVIIVHYFGEINRRALDFINSNQRRWAAVEDCVQSAYTEGVGTVGEYAVTSLRKWWPAPDGATIHHQDSLWNPQLMEPNEQFLSLRVRAKILREADAPSEKVHLDLVSQSEALIAQCQSARRPSWLAELLINCADRKAMEVRRRDNAATLTERLSTTIHAGFPLAFAHQLHQRGVVPFVFPAKVPEAVRDPLLEWLSQRRIFCPIHWRLRDGASARAQEFSARSISLPIDQRYDRSDMHRLADAVQEFFADWSA